MNSSSNSHSSLPYSIHQLAFILQRLSDDLLIKEIGTTFSQVRLMSALSDNPGCEQKTLARILNQTEAGISRQLKAMQKSGAVEVRRDNKDGRKRHVYLTVYGKHNLTKSNRLLETLHNDLLSGLSSSDVATIKDSLDSLVTLASLSHSHKN